MIENVKEYLKAGLSLIPVDNTKRPPVVAVKDGIELRMSWEKYKETPITFEEFEYKFKKHNAFGAGVVCGKVSGNLECLDIDCKNDKDGNLWAEFCALVEDQSPGLLRVLFIETTVSGGYHIVYRLRDDLAPGNTKLASNKEGEVLIETRGEGGYFVCAPTQGYSVWQGSLLKLPCLSMDEREILISVAKSLDCIQEESQYQHKQTPISGYNGLTPFDDYDSDPGNMFDLLESKSWKVKQGRNNSSLLTRPGKESGISATFNQKNRAGLTNRLFIFSSSVKELPNNVLLKPSAVYTILLHGGNFEKSASQLYKEGYGDRVKKVENLQRFWSISFEEKKKKYSLNINHDDLLRFIQSEGFAPFFVPGPSGDSIFIHNKNNIVEEVTPHKIKEYVLNWVDSLDEELPKDDAYPESIFTRKQLREMLVVKEKTLFCDTKLQCIKSVEIKWNRDTKEEAYFYFKNGFIVVSSSGFRFDSYENLTGAIWKTQIIQRDYIHSTCGGDYEQFVMNICGGESSRIATMKTAIGYLLHRYKNPSNSKAIILTDEVIADSSEGGTGKSLIANGVAQLRKVAVIDGKDFKSDNQFSFSVVGLDTDLVVFDDISKDFDFERLFHKITGGLTIEEKNRPKIKLSAEESPKFLITTNFVVLGENHSANRRKSEYELAPYYGKDKTPVSEFGRNFFHDWDLTEWSRFDSFALNCVQMFLKDGLKESDHKNLEFKKARQETHPDFAEWFQFYFSQSNPSVVIEEEIQLLFNDFCTFSEEHRQLAEMQRFRQEKFTHWLKSYCKYFNTPCEVKRMASKKNRAERVRYFYCEKLPSQIFSNKNP